MNIYWKNQANETIDGFITDEVDAAAFAPTIVPKDVPFWLAEVGVAPDFDAPPSGYGAKNE